MFPVRKGVCIGPGGVGYILLDEHLSFEQAIKHVSCQEGCLYRSWWGRLYLAQAVRYKVPLNNAGGSKVTLSKQA